MSKKIIRGFRTNMALYGLCLMVFVIVTIPFEPLLALAEAAVAVQIWPRLVVRIRLASKML